MSKCTRALGFPLDRICLSHFSKGELSVLRIIFEKYSESGNPVVLQVSGVCESIADMKRDVPHVLPVVCFGEHLLRCVCRDYLSGIGVSGGMNVFRSYRIDGNGFIVTLVPETAAAVAEDILTGFPGDTFPCYADMTTCLGRVLYRRFVGAGHKALTMTASEIRSYLPSGENSSRAVFEYHVRKGVEDMARQFPGFVCSKAYRTDAYGRHVDYVRFCIKKPAG